MSLGLCRQKRDSSLVRVSLISATIDNRNLGLEEVDRIANTLSTRFGCGMQYEHMTSDGYRPARQSDLQHYRPWMAREGKVWARVWCNTSGGDQKLMISGRRTRTQSRLDWAFIHREGEGRVSRDHSNGKSVWIFLRNGVDGCIPCTFQCPGCKAGSIRLTVSGLSPYDIDSEVVAESALDSTRSALGASSVVDYAKKGLAWNGYIPRQIAHFSGPWFNLALMDYLHRYAAVMPDFTYPPEGQSGSDDAAELGQDPARERRLWFPPWRTNR